MRHARLLAALLLAASPAAVRAEGLDGSSGQALALSAQSYRSQFCSAAGLLGGFKNVRCTNYGDFNQKDLIAAAKAVFGEASADPDEQCAVAQVIFNRARDEGKHVAAIVTAPGQFEGYSSTDRRECEKLKGAVAAVAVLAEGNSCRFGRRNFKYFCSISGWNRVKGKRKRGSEQPEFIGDTAFLVNGPC